MVDSKIMNNCIKCGRLSNEKKILINSTYLDLDFKKPLNKDCKECLEQASKNNTELADIINKKNPKIRSKDYIRAALHEENHHFKNCVIKGVENVPINEIGPMNGELLCKNDSKDKIDLRKACVGNFYWLHELLKTDEQYSKIYKEKIVNEQCFNKNDNMMLEFPIILVTPPCRGIKRKSEDVKLRYYVEDGNHRLLKWIDSGIKEGKPVETVAAFVIIDPEYAP